nr:g-type lectin s-receptor-like serine/threonine-protein kinase lecrk1 [Quercus suber]
MASIIALFHYHLLVFVITLLVPAIAQVNTNISVGSALFATDDDSTWTSPSGDFSFDSAAFQVNKISSFLLSGFYSQNTYGAYYAELNVTELIMDKSGYLLIKSSLGAISNLSSEGEVLRTDSDSYYRATLDFDGVFRLCTHPKNFTGDQTWSAIRYVPENICLNILDTFGSDPCGYNSICSLRANGKPDCQCAPGFFLLDVNNKYSGCKQDDVSYMHECSEMGTVISEDQFEILDMENADWPLTAYELRQPTTEFECKKSCLHDCYCAVAIFQDPKYNNGTGRCWKKRLPLSNGRYNPHAVDRKALFKILKMNSSLQNPTNPDPGQGKQDHAISILAVLLGTSVFFNLCSVAAISLVFFCLWQGKLPHFYRTLHTKDLDMNLRSFTYKDLEEATSGFKEELGRGSFGTVYKGVTASSYSKYVAVKKLDKMIKEGEREFKTEVTVIGQTHHKNLVWLLGYCDEGEHRILVYEFMYNGSLSSFLFGVIRPSWQQRTQIALGIARGLMYLHEECSMQIIHCDIKPQNILLDDFFTSKISDFGLAKLLVNHQTRTLTSIRGTKGYVEPEWFRNTPVTIKVDVYSFGVMLLEIVCCRRCVEVEMERAAILTEWAYDCYSRGKVERLVENDEEAISDMNWVKKLSMVAICAGDPTPSGGTKRHGKRQRDMEDQWRLVSGLASAVADVLNGGGQGRRWCRRRWLMGL